MCGIAGIFQPEPYKGKLNHREITSLMCDSLKRRGPDSGGLWSADNFPITLGHRRLSIIDLSIEGNQPMISSSGKYVICFNGEIYNFLDIRKKLEEKNIIFKGRSDTEILLSSFEIFGIAQTLQKIKGMFAIALYDRDDKKIHFIRDHLGKKPLYLAMAGNDLLFASQVKSFRQHPEFNPVINKNAVSQYLKFGYIAGPLSIYENAFSLIPGGILTVDLNNNNISLESLKNEVTKYWDAKNAAIAARSKIAENKKLSEDEIYNNFHTIISNSVERRMISDVSLGAFLSGGIDSSAVVSLMQSLSSRPIKTYTIGFDEKDFNESEKAKMVASHLGTEHSEIIFTHEDALKIIPDIADIYDEPFSDVSQIPTSLLCSFTKKHVSVALSGDGGDEMFGGYNRYLIAPSILNKTRFIPRPVGNIISSFINYISPEIWDKIGNRKIPQMGEKMQKLASIIPLKDRKEIYDRLLSKNISDEYFIDIPEPEGLSFAEQMMFYDTLFYLPNDILMKMDRASMYYSLECRSPLLDIDIFDFTWSLPEIYKIRDGKGKYLLRKLIKQYINSDILNQPKQGFNVPISLWIKGPLKEWAETILSKENIEKYDFVNYEQVKKIWDIHISGKSDYGHRLWSILMLHSWAEKYS